MIYVDNAAAGLIGSIGRGKFVIQSNINKGFFLGVLSTSQEEGIAQFTLSVMLFLKKS